MFPKGKNNGNEKHKKINAFCPSSNINLFISSIFDNRNTPVLYMRLGEISLKIDLQIGIIYYFVA